MCYYDQPAAAEGNGSWYGPSAKAPEGAVLHYVRRCAETGITPKLGKVQDLVSRLLAEGKMPPGWQWPAGGRQQQQQQYGRPQQQRYAPRPPQAPAAGMVGQQQPYYAPAASMLGQQQPYYAPVAQPVSPMFPGGWQQHYPSVAGSALSHVAPSEAAGWGQQGSQAAPAAAAMGHMRPVWPRPGTAPPSGLHSDLGDYLPYTAMVGVSVAGAASAAAVEGWPSSPRSRLALEQWSLADKQRRSVTFAMMAPKNRTKAAAAAREQLKQQLVDEEALLRPRRRPQSFAPPQLVPAEGNTHLGGRLQPAVPAGEPRATGSAPAPAAAGPAAAAGTKMVDLMVSLFNESFAWMRQHAPSEQAALLWRMQELISRQGLAAVVGDNRYVAAAASKASCACTWQRDQPAGILATAFEQPPTPGSWLAAAASATPAASAVAATVAPAAARAAAAAAAPALAAAPVAAAKACASLLFDWSAPTPEQVLVHKHHLQSLDLVKAPAGEVALKLTLPNGREISLDGCVVDSGANLPLVTEEFCKAHGITVHALPTPAMRDIYGEEGNKLLGRTSALRLTLGPDTVAPTHLSIAGAFVVPGNAGGLYSFCLDKQTLAPVYGHVNPLYQHLVWYPRAAGGDFSILNGVPTSSVPEQVALVALQHGALFSSSSSSATRTYTGCAAIMAVPVVGNGGNSAAAAGSTYSTPLTLAKRDAASQDSTQPAAAVEEEEEEEVALSRGPRWVRWLLPRASSACAILLSLLCHLGSYLDECTYGGAGLLLCPVVSRAVTPLYTAQLFLPKWQRRRVRHKRSAALPRKRAGSNLRQRERQRQLRNWRWHRVPGVSAARVTLLLLLCMLSTLASAAAMQATGVPTVDGVYHSVPPEHLMYLPPQIHNNQLLAHELGRLHCSRFRGSCCGRE